MRYGILGPLEIRDGERMVALAQGRQRLLLAALLLHANRAVSRDLLIDALWGEAPPASATGSLHNLVSGLRKALGEGRLVTQGHGYLLHVADGELDARRFDALSAEGRATLAADPERAAELLREALALWRGPAFGDLAYEAALRDDAASLEERRLGAVEDRIDADLALARHAELVAELDGLVAAHPLRERLRGQQMLALYRSGRQAEALHAYAHARRHLVEQLGIEPGPPLRGLERAILQQDRALDLTQEAPRPLPARHVAAPDRSLLVVPRALDQVDSLLALAEPLAASSLSRELTIASIVEQTELAPATAALAERRNELLGRGLAARTAAFSSPMRGKDVVRLASQQSADLLLMHADSPPLGGEAGVILDEAPCDVAMLVDAGGSLRTGPVLVPFGAAWHDWAALELGAWIARATDAPLRLIGAASDGGDNGRDASRLLADASLIVQRIAGVVAEPLLATPGRRGVLAAADGAGLLVVGLSERWRQDGLGRVRTQLVESPQAPTVLVRRGPRPGGLAPPETATRFGWSVTVNP